MGFGDFVFVLLSLFLISFALTGLGFMIAWKLDSTQGFHAIMNLFLMPLWFLSGALFPMTHAPQWLRAVIVFNPLTYGVAALHLGFFRTSEQMGLHSPNKMFCLTVMAGFAAASFLLSAVIASKNE